MSTTIEVIDPEVVSQQVQAVERSAGLSEDTAVALRGQFENYFNSIVEWRGKVAMITNPDDPVQQRAARDIRLGLRRVRCEVENTRKALKADSLARSKAIDGFANVLKYLCEPVEAWLLDVEERAERLEAARIAALVQERSAQLVAAESDPTAYNLAVMDDGTFTLVLNAAKQKQAERAEAARKAESERIAREQADRIAREKAEQEAAEARATAERERKAREAAEQKAARERAASEAKARKEREAAEAELRAEREAREKAEREAAEAKRREQERAAAEKRAQEEARRKEREAAEKAARAPEKNKLIRFAGMVRFLERPAMATDAGRAMMAEIDKKCDAFADWIEKRAGEL